MFTLKGTQIVSESPLKPQRYHGVEGVIGVVVSVELEWICSWSCPLAGCEVVLSCGVFGMVALVLPEALVLSEDEPPTVAGASGAIIFVGTLGLSCPFPS